MAWLGMIGEPAAAKLLPKGSADKPTATTSTTAVRKTQRAAKAVARTRPTASAARRRELQEARKPRFKVDENGVLVPDVRAEAAIVYNPETGKVLWEENSQSMRSIASITKVMTASVFLEGDPDLSQQVVVERADVRNASTTHLKAGYKVTVDDLLHLLLIASDNAAARVLARVSPFGSEGFINRMNAKAAELGLEKTTYADPSGLFAANVSSAYDLARLIAYVSTDDRIASIMRTPYFSFLVGRRTVQVHSTNQLVMNGDVDVEAGKTGFIRSAGYCLATLLRLPEGSPVAVVILGAKSNAGRFWETRHLFNWLSTQGSDWLGATTASAVAVATAATAVVAP